MSHCLQTSIISVFAGLLATLPALAQPVLWNQRAVNGPSPRDGHGLAYYAPGGVSVLFGGWTGSSANDETWEWNGGGPGSWTRRLVPGPTPREGHAMVYDSARNVCVLFGGNDGFFLANNETWVWNGNAWLLQSAPGPSPRFAHAMAFDEARGVAVLFGGFVSGRNGETWEWNGSFWNLRAFTGPTPRYQHAMTYDAARRVTVLFGGNSGGFSSETWEWDGLGWNMRSSVTPAPSARVGHAMAYDAGRRVSVLFGGQTGSANGETWEWNGVAWNLRPGLTSPSPRYLDAMAYDQARGTMMLFGGWNGTNDNGETWELGSPCTIPTVSQPSPTLQVVCPGQSATYSVTATGTMPFSFQWFDPAGNPIAGATGAILTLTAVSAAQNGTYFCTVTNGCGMVTSTGARFIVCAADFNCDGIVDFFDYLDFVSAFSQGQRSADFNRDGVIDFFDYLDFVNAYSAGC